MKAILFLSFILMAACAPEPTVAPYEGRYIVKSDTDQWTWNLVKGGKLYESYGYDGGCGEWAKGEKDTFILTSGLWKIRYVGRIYPTLTGWEFEHQHGAFTLTRI